MKRIFKISESPISTEKLSVIKPPCFRFQKIVYNFKGHNLTIFNKRFCIDGRFHQYFAEAIVQGIDKSYAQLEDMKNDAINQLVKLQATFNDFKESYK